MIKKLERIRSALIKIYKDAIKYSSQTEIKNLIKESTIAYTIGEEINLYNKICNSAFKGKLTEINAKFHEYLDEKLNFLLNSNKLLESEFSNIFKLILDTNIGDTPEIFNYFNKFNEWSDLYKSSEELYQSLFKKLEDKGGIHFYAKKIKNKTDYDEKFELVNIITSLYNRDKSKINFLDLIKLYKNISKSDKKSEYPSVIGMICNELKKSNDDIEYEKKINFATEILENHLYIGRDNYDKKEPLKKIVELYEKLILPIDNLDLYTNNKKNIKKLIKYLERIINTECNKEDFKYVVTHLIKPIFKSNIFEKMKPYSRKNQFDKFYKMIIDKYKYDGLFGLNQLLEIEREDALSLVFEEINKLKCNTQATLSNLKKYIEMLDKNLGKISFMMNSGKLIKFYNEIHSKIYSEINDQKHDARIKTQLSQICFLNANIQKSLEYFNNISKDFLYSDKHMKLYYDYICSIVIDSYTKINDNQRIVKYKFFINLLNLVDNYDNFKENLRIDIAHLKFIKFILCNNLEIMQNEISENEKKTLESEFPKYQKIIKKFIKDTNKEYGNNFKLIESHLEEKSIFQRTSFEMLKLCYKESSKKILIDDNNEIILNSENIKNYLAKNCVFTEELDAQNNIFISAMDDGCKKFSQFSHLFLKKWKEKNFFKKYIYAGTGHNKLDSESVINNIKDKFSEIKKKFDSMFAIVNIHGTMGGEQNLVKDIITKFTDKIAKLKIFWIDSCYSGKYSDEKKLPDNSVLILSSLKSEQSTTESSEKLEKLDKFSLRELINIASSYSFSTPLIKAKINGKEYGPYTADKFIANVEHSSEKNADNIMSKILIGNYEDLEW